MALAKGVNINLGSSNFRSVVVADARCQGNEKEIKKKEVVSAGVDFIFKTLDSEGQDGR